MRPTKLHASLLFRVFDNVPYVFADDKSRRYFDSATTREGGGPGEGKGAVGVRSENPPPRGTEISTVYTTRPFVHDATRTQYIRPAPVYPGFGLPGPSNKNANEICKKKEKKMSRRRVESCD